MVIKIAFLVDKTDCKKAHVKWGGGAKRKRQAQGLRQALRSTQLTLEAVQTRGASRGVERKQRKNSDLDTKRKEE